MVSIPEGSCHSFPFDPPALDLDSEVLPPLDEFSSLDDTLGDLTGDLANLPSLELPLSSTLSPRICNNPNNDHMPSDSSVSSRSLSSSPQQTAITLKQDCCPDVRAALNEVSARLKAATSENSALRSRVADLVKENRTLRTSLDVSQKQAAAAANPLLLGLAQVSAESAKALANVLNVVPKNKKRKRGNAAGKTLACLVLMCGFFFGTTPGVIHDTERTDANLPAIWNSNGKNPSISSNSKVLSRPPPPVRPSLCLRSLEQLPPPDLVADRKDEKTAKGVVKVKKEENVVVAPTSAHVIEPAPKKRRVASNTENFSYVMCRDTPQAVEQVAQCSQKQEQGLQCGAPHSISLIMPASALVGEMEDDDTTGDDGYAEVLCDIRAVKRIAADQTAKFVSGVTVARSAMMTSTSNRNGGVGPIGLGRVLTSVREEVVGT